MTITTVPSVAERVVAGAAWLDEHEPGWADRIDLEVNATVKERIAAGARWLDEHDPGWYRRIHLDSLDMASCRRCVLGHLYGGYMEATDQRVGGLSAIDAAGLGFDVDGPTPDRGEAEFEALTAAWRELIEARVTAANASMLLEASTGITNSRTEG